MYSLLITAGAGHWDGPPYTFGAGRVFEYTSNLLIERFGALEPPALGELLSLPCLFAYEQGEDTDARVGRILTLRRRNGDVRIEYAMEPNLPAIPAQRVSELVWELDIGNWELNRTHWAIKDVDLFVELVCANVFTEAQVRASQFGWLRVAPPIAFEVHPTVFRLPANAVEPDLVSVMRPFQPAFQPVYVALQAICRDLGVRCLDANEVWNENEIIQDIFSLIYRSRVVVCDFSDRNPNVFYEAGIAHTLGRPVIPIVQNAEHIPFDLRHHRHVRYLNNNEGLADLQRTIAPRLRHLFGR